MRHQKFQGFRTQSRTHDYSITVLYLESCIGLCFIFFKINCLSQGIVRCQCLAMQIFDCKNSIAMKLYFIILNMFLTSERSQSKK